MSQVISKYKLPSVFNSMSASYKAYWFIGMLECINEEGLKEIPIKRVCARMVVNAWYPVHFFKLNFGVQDLISRHSILLKDKLGVEADIAKDKLLELLMHSENTEVQQLILHFQKNVTYRFLSPWIKYKSDAQVESDSKLLLNDAPYSIDRAKGTITVSSSWELYLKNNYAVLKDYGYWQLAQYVQTKNPGIPDVVNKLIKPAKRESLSKQRAYWNLVFKDINSISCIYSNTSLKAPDYAVEHYIPWSFTAHNQLWNLIPANTAINSSKSNKLPHIKFLERFVEIQRLGLQYVYRRKPSHALFEDYVVFGTSVSELLNLDRTNLYDLFFKQITPQLQLAKQLGFREWEK